VVIALGLVTAVMNVAFMAAIVRIPLGTTVAVEFLGPMAAAAWRSHNRRGLVWLLAALVGVVLVSHPWAWQIGVAGVGFALAAGAAWGVYILLTQHIGTRLSGIQALALTIPIAAVVSAPLGVANLNGAVTVGLLAATAGLAWLNPVVPFALELQALRRMTPTAFGTLMALEPAVAVVIGLLALGQTPSAYQVLGIILVVLAGAAAQRQPRPAASPAPA
jgi:inner membrane transporter RhtA